MTTNEEAPDNTSKANIEQEQAIGELSPMLVILLLIPLLGILAILMFLANGIRLERANISNQDGTGNPLALTDSAAPDFELPDLDGNLVSLSDYRGKILFLNFWQTTCPPCIREMPDFVTFIGEQDDDVTWLTVNIDETPTMVRAFFTEYSFVDIPVVMSIDSNISRDYAIIGFPITYVLDAEGIIRYTQIGALTYQQMNDILLSVREGA
jgi:peroxiredoxin